MPGNGKVFISHAHEDNDRCAPLLAALDAWGMDYWFDTQRMDAGDDLGERIQNAIASHDVFLRVCTQAAQTSYWMGKELGAFMGLQAANHKDGNTDRRRLIPVRLDAAYQFKPFELGTLYIDAVNLPQRAWLEAVRKALGVAVMIAGHANTNPTEVDPNHQPAEHNLSSPRAIVESERRIWTVDRDRPGDYASIGAAIEAARPGDQILVKPGLYREALVVDKSIDIVGDGGAEEIVIEAANKPVVQLEAPNARIVGLSLRRIGGKKADTEGSPAVTISYGKSVLEACDVTCLVGPCITISSSGNPVLRGNRLHHGIEAGIKVENGARGIIEDNDICDNQGNGVLIRTGSNPSIRSNRVSGSYIGVMINEKANGTLENNDIFANAFCGVAIYDECAPVLHSNRITKNNDRGIVLSGRVDGFIEDNDLRANRNGGIFRATGFAGGNLSCERNLE